MYLIHAVDMQCSSVFMHSFQFLIFCRHETSFFFSASHSICVIWGYLGYTLTKKHLNLKKRHLTSFQVISPCLALDDFNSCLFTCFVCIFIKTIKANAKCFCYLSCCMCLGITSVRVFPHLVRFPALVWFRYKKKERKQNSLRSPEQSALGPLENKLCSGSERMDQ